MAYEDTNPWLVVLLLLAATCIHQSCVHGEPQVPCIFIFGDSLSDSGNNNNLRTKAKSNYKPYGIDFPSGPTGRFTNGPTSIDYITEFLGFDSFIPAFLNTNGSDILRARGANYASGGAGIRGESGKHMGDNINLGLQISYHLLASQYITKYEDSDKASQDLNKCLYYVNIGNNDYINNYFLPQYYPASHLYTIEKYADVLIEEYSTNMMALRDLGARKFVLVGIGLIGCTPNAISTRGTNGSSCVEEENRAAFIFNDKLKALVDRYNKQFSDSKFIFVNSTFSSNLEQFGFTVLDKPCCPAGSNVGMCVPDETPCQNRNQNVFYDGYHPTSAVNALTAIALYNGSDPNFTYPIDIRQLVHS